ncbi:hypothetical protein TKK_0010272 [Trichogramma kaykai]
MDKEGEGKPVCDLTIYDSLKCSNITVKVIFKSEKITLQSGKQLFFITASNSTGHIKCNFIDNNCKRFFNVIKINEIYNLRKFLVVEPNPIFNYLYNDVEINITNQTIVEKSCAKINCKPLKMKIIELAEIPQLPKNQIITTTASIQKIGPITTFYSQKRKKQFRKRELELIDDNNFKIILTMWGNAADILLEINTAYIFQYVTVYEANYCKALNSMHITTVEKRTPTQPRLMFEDIDEDAMCAILDEIEKTESSNEPPTKNEDAMCAILEEIEKTKSSNEPPTKKFKTKNTSPASPPKPFIGEKKISLADKKTE